MPLSTGFARGRSHSARRPASAGRKPTVCRPSVEMLEDRTLLNGQPVVDFSSLRVDPAAHDAGTILVHFRSEPADRAGQAILNGTTIGKPLALVPGLREVQLADGVSVEQALAADRKSVVEGQSADR